MPNKCTPTSAARTWDTCSTDTEPSGAFPRCRSRFGVYDMHGNVAEIMTRREQDGTIVSQLKGSAFFYAEVSRKANEPQKPGPETYPDTCNYDPRWHVEPIDERVARELSSRFSLLQKHPAPKMKSTEETFQREMRDALLGEEPAARDDLPPRVAIYRRLVRNTLADVVHKVLPRTRERMGRAFDDAFATFLDARGPRTHYLRDVPRELVEWAAPFWSEQGVESWLVDLARHEMTWFAVATVPHVPEPRAEEVAIDKALLLSSVARIERFSHAVHESFENAPTQREVALLYYRDEKHDLATLELSPLAASLLLHVNLPLKDAIARACEETNIPMNDDALASVARLLADLGARGVLLGARS